MAAAEAFRVCAKKAGVGNNAACLGWQAKALAMRKGGEMLRGMDLKKAGRPAKELLHDEIITWESIDLTAAEGHRWSRVAASAATSPWHATGHGNHAADHAEQHHWP